MDLHGRAGSQARLYCARSCHNRWSAIRNNDDAGEHHDHDGAQSLNAIRPGEIIQAAGALPTQGALLADWLHWRLVYLAFARQASIRAEPSETSTGPMRSEMRDSAIYYVTSALNDDSSHEEGARMTAAGWPVSFQSPALLETFAPISNLLAADTFALLCNRQWPISAPID